MSCFILCQDCGEIYDTWGDVHNCVTTGVSVGVGTPEFCDNCGQHGNDLLLRDGTYSHKDLRDCIKNLRDEINQSEGHNIENDSRFCDIEKKLFEFVEGRRAAVEATKEKMFQTEGEDNE